MQPVGLLSSMLFVFMNCVQSSLMCRFIFKLKNNCVIEICSKVMPWVSLVNTQQIMKDPHYSTHANRMCKT